MRTSAPRLDDLPNRIPVFPLPEVLLLPGGRLPLNIFEPRYLAMVEDAMAADRMIGMIQPLDPAQKSCNPSLYETGCAGRICQFEETGDGRYLIALLGICRFRMTEELPMVRGYRCARPDWSGFAGDLAPTQETGLNRNRLLAALHDYFKMQGIAADWEAIAEAPDERLVTCLAMICPFGPSEKQALLEAPTPAARSQVLTTLVEMAALSRGCPSGKSAC